MSKQSITASQFRIWTLLFCAECRNLIQAHKREARFFDDNGQSVNPTAEQRKKWLASANEIAEKLRQSKARDLELFYGLNQDIRRDVAELIVARDKLLLDVSVFVNPEFDQDAEWSSRFEDTIALIEHNLSAIEERQMVLCEMLPRKPEEWPREAPAGLQILTPLQSEILAALDGQSLKVEPLANKVSGGDTKKLYKDGGLNELKAAGLVMRQNGIGYFRPDAPPPELIPPVKSAAGEK